MIVIKSIKLCFYRHPIVINQSSYSYKLNLKRNANISISNIEKKNKTKHKTHKPVFCEILQFSKRHFKPFFFNEKKKNIHNSNQTLSVVFSDKKKF